MTRRVIAATLFVCCGPVSLLAAWNGFDWYLDGPTLLIAILAGYTAGAWLPRLEAAGSVVLSTSLLVLANQALGDGFHWLDDLVFFAVLVGGPALAGAAVKARALHVGRLARLQAELEEQQRIDVEAARLDVLNGVQAEVHADLAERIAGIALRAEGALRGGDRTALPVLERQARQVLDLLRDAVGSMREETPTAADVPEPEPTAPRTDWSPSDALMAAALAVAMGVEVALTSDARGPLLWVDVVGAAAVCTPLVWRRTHPILAAAVSSALGVLMSAWLTPISSLVTGIALLSALFYSIGAWCPARRLLLGGAITAAGVVAIELVGPGEGVGPVLLWSLSALLLGRIVSGWQERLRRTREVVEALERGRGAAVRLAVAREREALASTLHDTVAHGMTVVCLHAGARQRQGSGQDATLSLIAQVAAQSLDELKNGLETIESRAAPLDPARLYAFSRFRFAGRRGGLAALMIIQMFPQMLAFVAIFLLLLSLREVFPLIGLGEPLGLIAVYLGGALGANTFLMYGFFNTIPRELDEAAKIDGATHAQVFWGIIMRLVSPILAVVALLSFVSSYGEFILARIVLQRPENYTLAVGLYEWASDERNAPWSLFAAGAVLAAIPIILLFMFLQKYIVSGLTAGGVKG